MYNRGLHASDEDMQWWRDAKLGMFIHWGPVTLRETEIGWSRAGLRRGFEWTGDAAKVVPAEEYDNLYKQFNPTKFDAEEWVRNAKSVGAKYLIFTTKHHDGFCMFDSKLTDYKITNSPIDRDLLAELADACHKNDFKLGLYYSAPDWHHPDFFTENHGRFLEYFKGQLQELCTNYGKISNIWFDCGESLYPYDAANTIKMVRKLQPGVIINNRLGLPADHDTPEQVIGTFNNERAWESCMTIGDQWSWRKNENLKPSKVCIQSLVSCAVGDGNLLFGIGPGPTGEMEPAHLDRYREVGDWLGKYGESIYGTRGGPFLLDKLGGSTFKDNRIYLHIFDWPDAVIKLPAIPGQITECAFFNGEKIDFKQTDEGIEIPFPETKRNPIDTVITMTLDGPASTIEPMIVVDVDPCL